jgi:hypothetical protein
LRKNQTVAIPFRRELGLILAWLVFPLVPVVLEDLYYQICTFELFGSARIGPDPIDWDWQLWLIMLGPLLGYGFLAGSTLGHPNELGARPRALRQLQGRRSVWVAIGPWVGLLFWTGAYLATFFILGLFQEQPSLSLNVPESWSGTWAETVVNWALGLLFIGVLAYGWLWIAWAALSRASRRGGLAGSLCRGFAVATGFVGSLFGSFWAATALWRSYFFDTRLVPLVLIALVLAGNSGCGSPVTYGQMRRRELFHAMLAAWVLGLALMWRWWSRRRPRPPRERSER